MDKKEEFYDKIIRELNLDNFLGERSDTHKMEKRDIKNQIKLVLSSLIHHPEKTIQHTNLTLKFLRIVWKKYDCEKIANLFEQFAKIEPTLLSLGGTRDHFLHSFHVFLFGLRIISKIISEMKTESQNILKIRDESKKTCMFSYPYNYKERLFYIWTLASTFHDIGYPLEYLPKIEKGLQEFTDFCKYTITPLNFQLDYTDIIELDTNLRLISGLYGGKLAFKEIEPEVYAYEKIEHLYFYKVLISAFRERDHGVLSAIILLRVIEYIFLFPLEYQSKYPLEPLDFNNYIKYYYNNDIVRMALIISLHNLRGENIPRVPKIKFSEFPLGFILILADEFQEFLRKKTNLREERIILKKIPDIEVIKDENGLSIIIKCLLDEIEISEIKKITEIEDIDKALELFWKDSTKSLERRLLSESKYKVIFETWKDNEILYKWSLI